MFRDQSLSTYSSFSFCSVVAVASERDKPQLVGYGSTLLVMSERSGI